MGLLTTYSSRYQYCIKYIILDIKYICVIFGAGPITTVFGVLPAKVSTRIVSVPYIIHLILISFRSGSNNNKKFSSGNMHWTNDNLIVKRNINLISCVFRLFWMGFSWLYYFRICSRYADPGQQSIPKKSRQKNPAILNIY